MLSSLRRALALPQVLMCAQQWTEIDLSSVPSLAMARYKRAYLNEGKGCCRTTPSAPRVETTSSKCFRKRESRRSRASSYFRINWWRKC